MELKELQRRSKTKLQELAKDVGLPGWSQMAKPALIAALAEHFAGSVGEQVTPEQIAKIQGATLGGLESIEDDPDLSEALRCVVKDELGRRRAEQAEAERLARCTPIDQYVVTSGPGYLWLIGHRATLPNGALVSPLTYDLEELRRQGFSLRKCDGVVLSEDQLGNQRSAAV